MPVRLSCSILLFAVVPFAVAQPSADPPAGFAQPQSPAKPAPFPVKYVDQGGYDPRLKGILAPEGFKLEVVADAPTVVNPVGMTFTPDGTLMVLEWKPDPYSDGKWFEFKETFRYRDGTTKQVATMKKFVGDPLKEMTYNPKTGRFDAAKVVIVDELPSTVLYHDGWLYLTGRGTVRRYRQSRPGGLWDVKETIAQGFCGFHHHQVSGLTIGPDGWLYITSGDDDNFAEGSDGSRATVLRTGAVFRCKPDGSKMETFSIGYRNPYRDLALDARFNWFHADNDNEDGSRFTGCRLVHVAEEVDYGWRLREGARCCQPDHVRGAVAGERPGKLQPMLKTGRGSPAGVLIYNDTQLPEQYRGLMYYPDVFRKSVRAYTVAPKGSTFEITHEFEFLKSDDPLFRPCQMVTGPDGAVYVCDWRTDSGGAGKLWGDGEHGRIYRLSWAGTADTPAIPLRGMDTWKAVTRSAASLDDVCQGCLSPDQTTRSLSLIELVRRSAGNPAPAREFLKGCVEADGDAGKKHPTEVRLLGLYGLQQLWADDVKPVFVAALKEKDVDVRRVAIEVLGRQISTADFAANEAVMKCLSDESPSVRRAAALAVGRIGSDVAADALASAIKHEDGKDAFLSDAYLRGVERLGKRGIQALLTAAQSGDDAGLRKVVAAFTALRTRPAADALPDLLLNPHLTPDQKAAVIRSYMNYQFDPPLSLEPLAKFLASRPDEPKEAKIAGLDVLAASGGLGGGKGNEFVLGLMDSAVEDIRLAAYRAVEGGRVLTAAAKLRAAVGDTKKSQAERTAILKAGRTAGGAEFVPAVKDVLASDKESAALKVEALRVLSAIDAGSARAFAEQFLAQPDPALIGESISVLGATKAGAKLVGERYLAKKLPRDLFPQVSDVLRKFPNDDAIAKLNADVLRGGLMLSLEPDQVEKIRGKVTLSGDARRGKAVYLNTAAVACATCHKMEGVGGAVGPDLTRIWDTMTVEKLLETIVTPSNEIKEGYQTYKATTLGGQSYIGLKVTDTADEVIIRDSTGRDVKIARKDLDELAAQKQSLMPDNVVSQLSYDQFIDLLAFLKSRKEQESLRGVVLELGGAVGVSGDFKTPLQAEAETDPAKITASSGSKGVTLTTDPGGLFALKPVLPADPTGVLLAAYVFSPKKQTANVTLLADDAARVSANGKPAFERAGPKAAPFAQEEKFTVDLEPGWTRVTVRLLTNGPTHRLGLQFSGDDLRTAARPEK